MTIMAEEIIALSLAKNAEGVLQKFYAIPTRDLLTVRTLLWESGAYEAVVDALIMALESPQPLWRYEAAGMLDRFGDARCIEPLLRLTHDPVPRVRRMAMHALSCDHCKIAPILSCFDFLPVVIRLAQTDPSVQVRRHALYILSEHREEARAAVALETFRAQETDPKLCQEIARLDANALREKQDRERQAERRKNSQEVP